jgi:hypothetical protein
MSIEGNLREIESSREAYEPRPAGAPVLKLRRRPDRPARESSSGRRIARYRGVRVTPRGPRDARPG